MAQVPREAVEFARMLVRSFYPSEFVVLLDAVLRHNNYCAHHDLSRRLKIQPKELRQILVRMVHARLMCNEKRQQKRINLKDERRATRLVNTEFWYVPLAQVVDAFQYRVHHLVTEIDQARANENAQQTVACDACRTAYELIEVIANDRTPDGNWVCDRMGVRRDRRKLPCGGVIREKDNSAQIKETERIKAKLDDELRVLRERAAQCARMDIPEHPLEGADEATWGELVPETVGIHGEAVDEEGLSKEIAEKLGESGKTAEPAGGLQGLAPAVEKKGDAAIPEKPMWFKDSNQEGDDDDDWVEDQAATQNMLDSKTGTAASMVDDEKQYYEKYMQQIAGEPVPVAVAKPKEAGNVARPAEATILDSGEKGTEAPTEAVPPVDDDEPEDVAVYVAGKKMMLSEVTDDMHDLMTSDEYNAYFALANGGGAGGDEDDDDAQFE